MTEAWTEFTWLSTQRPWDINRPSVFQMQNQLPLPFQGSGNTGNTGNTGIKESYGGPVTLSLPEWRRYRSTGMGNILSAGGIIPGNTYGGAVYRGHVRQGGWGL